MLVAGATIVKAANGRECARLDGNTQHFGSFVQYLGGLQKKGTIKSFDTVFLDPHGGDLNGFFLMRGEPSQLDALMSSPEWISHVTRASIHLEGSGMMRGVTGDLIQPRMELWTGMLPTQ
jgi:hypothetical protein